MWENRWEKSAIEKRVFLQKPANWARGRHRLGEFRFQLKGTHSCNIDRPPSDLYSSFGGFASDEGSYFEGGYEGGSFGDDGAGAWAPYLLTYLVS